MDNNTVHQQQLTKKQRREIKRQQKLEKQRKQKQKQQTKKIIRWLAVFLAIGGIILIIAKFGNSAPSISLPIDAVAESDQTKGSGESNIVLIEYSDFQCPACATYEPVLKQLIDEFGQQITFVYRHFPLRQIHKNAELAARSAEAAGIQGKFWQMHDLLFENQKEWSEKRRPEDIFTGYAKSLNLNQEKFKSDLGSPEIKQKVNNDYKSGVSARVQGTPTFFLNGQKLQNLRDYEEFKKVIQEIIDKIVNISGKYKYGSQIVL